MIPKICHLYWDGHPMSLLNTYTPLTFHRQNPDWRIIVYLTKQKYNEIAENNFVKEYSGSDYFHLVQAMDFVEIKEIDLIEYGINMAVPACSGSDIFRRNILYEFGGVYSDFDVLWLKPIEHIKNIECIGNPNDFQHIVSFYNYTYGFHNVSNLISEPQSSFLKSLIDYQETILPPYEHQSYGSSMLNKIYPTLNSINHDRMLAIKYETFYPYSIYDLSRLYKQNDLSVINNNVLCIHYFNGSDLTLEYMNTENFNKDCSMTTILKNEGLL